MREGVREGERGGKKEGRRKRQNEDCDKGGKRKGIKRRQERQRKGKTKERDKLMIKRERHEGKYYLSGATF